MTGFHSWMRKGLGAALGGAGESVDATLHVEATQEALIPMPWDPGPAPGPQTVQVQPSDAPKLAKAGHVHLIDGGAFQARFPPANSRGASPSNLATIVLREPDLPWRFSGKPEGGEVPDPWLMLVVVPVDASQFTPPSAVDGQRKPGVLTVDAAELPSPSSASSFAHVQQLDGELRARLIAPRRLDVDRNWRACVVPTGAGAREAGMTGLASELSGPAWDEGQVVLPVYATWTFRTGADEDFESLVGKLTPTPAEGVGPFDAEVQGLAEVDGSVQLTGLLGQPAAQTPPTVVAALRAGTVQQEHASGDPVVGHTRWGAALAAAAGLTDPAWLRELNETPALRVAAAAGADAVRANDTRVTDELWRQLGDAEPYRRDQEHAKLAAASRARWAARLGTSDNAALALLGGLARATEETELSRANVSRSSLSLAALRAARPGRSGSHTSMPAFRSELMSPQRSRSTVSLRALHVSRQLTGVNWTDKEPAQKPIADTDLGGLVGTLRERLHGQGKLSAAIDDQVEEGDAEVEIFDALKDDLLAARPDLWAPGLGALGDEVATVVEVRPEMVAAALIGANHELAREVRWRELPVEPDQPRWRSFWNDDTPDLLPLTESGDLASLLRVGDAIAVIIRGSLIERYPGFRIRLTGATGAGDARRPTSSAQEPLTCLSLDSRTLVAIFAGVVVGELRGDGRGAGRYLVLEEQSRDLRFGFEPASLTDGRAASWDDVSWDELGLTGPFLPAGAPPGIGRQLTPTWTGDAAKMAHILARRPFRIYVHASQLLPKERTP